jgi:hypothetical protein
MKDALLRHSRIFARALNGNRNLFDPHYCQKVRHLVLIVSASRSGSSWLTEILRGSENLASIPGEVDPLLLLAIPKMRESPAEDHSDNLGPEEVTPGSAEMLSLLLSWNVGYRQFLRSDWRLSGEQEFDLAMRTVWQWPEIDLDESLLFWAIKSCFGNANQHSSVDKVMLQYLKALKDTYPAINPYYYDLDYSIIKQAFPEEKLPVGPPSTTGVWEEPPFITFAPWVRTSLQNRSETPLILKSPSNSYRLDFYRALFPNALITLIHIIRNPLSSIADLMRGWKHHGFFKHRLQSNILNIEGYSDPALPWSCQWWKFDLPPGWGDYLKKPLVEVCTYQWLSANTHILQWVEKQSSDIVYEQIYYESMVTNLNQEILGLCKKINVPLDHSLFNASHSNRAIMASSGLSPEDGELIQKTVDKKLSCSAILEMQQAIKDAGSNINRTK